jgi:hypothetical protein
LTASGPGVPSAPRPSFAHASEAELARILDFYEVSWSYEPDTFPIGWNLDGDVVESFSPDFYLPDLDLYVELTTLKQKLVRKKNRKLRRLRELYPDIRIKLFYARDFRMLLLKFGRLALVDELTGTTGQATPPRAPAADDVASAPGMTGGGETGTRTAAIESEATSVETTPGEPAAVDEATVEPPAPRTEPVPALGDHAEPVPAVSAPAASVAVDLPPPTEGRGRRRGRRRRRPAG